MLSRSFNSNFTAVSSFHYGSSRDLHGSQGSVALSVADGRGSGGHIFRVSTCSRPVLLVRVKKKNPKNKTPHFNVLTVLENTFLLWVKNLDYLPVLPWLSSETFCKADLGFIKFLLS